MISRYNKNIIFNSLAVLLVLVGIIASSYAQVTLSTGWGPGKRSSECKMDIPTIFRMCHSLMVKLRSFMLCQSRIMEEYQEPGEDPAPNEIFHTQRF